METDSEGFIYPVIQKEQCISCGLCERKCPVINQPVVTDETLAEAVNSKNVQIRLESSSGGFFSLLAEFVLDQNGVVYGAAYGNGWEVKHQRIESLDQLPGLRGAKYSQSNSYCLFREVKNDLDSDRVVLFTGTPCQIAALKNYLIDEYEKLVLVDTVCHGVPSPLVWKRYLEERKKYDAPDSTITSINQRSKISGWSKYAYSVEIKYSNNKSYCVKMYQDVFMRGFVENLYLRPSCSACSFKGYNRCSDFTMGDCWGIWDIAPEIDDNKGTSLILLHSEKAKNIFDILSDRLIAYELTQEEALNENPSAVVSSTPHSNRKMFFEKMMKKKSISHCIEFCLNPQSEGKIKRILQRLLYR